MQQTKKEQKKEEKKSQDKQESVGITVRKDQDFSEWYTQVVIKSELADYSAVSGCMVIRPLGYAIWEKIKQATEERLKKMGVKNAYFPLFIPESLFQKEAVHVKGFAPEVAWVTHGGDTKLGERLAVRPTSEVIMYDSYSRWIRSWRDLPLKLAQWNNVVRWEFKHPTLLLRTREFLWVEGHTVFATKEEAEQEMHDIMDVWKDVCENYLALYGLHGRKTEKEKFAGAERTESLEFFVPNGKAAQGPDAHFDGNNFAKAFNISFLDKDGSTKFAFQNTWAITTRMIGVLVSVHGDDKGLVLPPMLAPNQVVIVPILFDDTKKDIIAACEKLKKELAAFEPLLDDRDGYTPGWKFNEWERKGVPVRIEFGPKDMKAQEAVLVRRDTGEKKKVPLKDVKKSVAAMLAAMQKDLLATSRKITEENTVTALSMVALIKAIEGKKLAVVPFCGSAGCEDYIKEKTGGASTRGIPAGSNAPKEPCIQCGKSATVWVRVAKSY